MHTNTTWQRRVLVLALGTMVASAPAVGALGVTGHGHHPGKDSTAGVSCAALAVNSQGAAVATIQTLIGATPDGDFGSQTQTSLKAWQSAHGIPSTGIVDAATWAAMPAATADAACGQAVSGSGVSISCPTLATGSTGIPVAVLQQALSLTPNGGFGSQTLAALEAAQTAHKLTATGTTSPATMSALGLGSTPACTSGTSAGSAAQAAVQAITNKRVAELETRTTTPTTPSVQAAIAFAQAQVGKPYKYGGVGPNSYDCSGLTMAAYASAAVTLPRTAAEQWASGGKRINLNNAQAGDLLFWANDLTDPTTIHHVALYLGNGTMLEAPYTGANVRVVPVYTQGLMPRVVRPGAGVSFPIEPGSTGAAVTTLQRALNSHGASVSVDGGYGPQTVAAVKKWQSQHHLAATGVVTAATWRSLT